ncbi:MAG: MgtC/SapB family protein [Clostridiales bacterium]|nr:MgtC/SapB family protein [Clostridiales bacterium]
MFPTADGAIFELKTLISISIALILGFAIGFERKLRNKEAGVRTHTVVCTAAALMVVVSKYGFLDSKSFDASRIAAQIVSGVGFLGVGIIMYRQKEVRGLTTAAGIWATAGVGMAAGAGLYIVATGATLILILAQCLLYTRFKIFNTKQRYRLNIVFKQTHDEGTVIKQLFGVKHFHSFTVHTDGDATVCEASISTEVMYSSEKLIAIQNEHPYIISIERIDAH